MKNKLIYGLAGLGLLGACQNGGKEKKVSDLQSGIYTDIGKSELNDTFQMNDETPIKYEKVENGGTTHNKNQRSIDKVIVHEETLSPEIKRAMLQAATYNMEYQKDPIHGDSITSWGDKFLDMPVGCSFMLQLIGNGWITYQDLLDAAQGGNISSFVGKVFNREYPEGPLTQEQEQQQKEDANVFVRMSLNACESDNDDTVDEQIFWIQTIRKESE